MPSDPTMTLVTIPVFYSEKMVANTDGYSPSAAKPKAVVSAWKQLGLPVTLVAPTVARKKQLELAHDDIYVGNVLISVTRMVPYGQLLRFTKTP